MVKICINNLKVDYKNKKKIIHALKGTTMEFESGSFNTILGYSGCGKTTLLKSIIGLTNYEGEILFDGVDAMSLDIKDRNISYVSQNYILYPFMTVFDNIAFPLKVMSVKRDEVIDRVNKLAEKLEIKHCLSRKPKELSGGQQQRVAIARALIKNPDICLLDEPLSNIDPVQREESKNIIVNCLKESSSTVLYVTHNLSEALSIGEKIFVLNEGELVISGTPEDVMKSHNIVIESLKPETLDASNF